MAGHGNMPPPVLRIMGAYDFVMPFKVYIEEAGLWAKINAVIGTNPAHPRGAEVTQIRNQVEHLDSNPCPQYNHQKSFQYAYPCVLVRAQAAHGSGAALDSH